MLNFTFSYYLHKNILDRMNGNNMNETNYFNKLSNRNNMIYSVLTVTTITYVIEDSSSYQVRDL